MLNAIYNAIDPVAISIGPFSIRWYGIAYLLGFIVGAAIIWRISKRLRMTLSLDTLSTILICEIVGVILGARLGYCLFYGDGYYLSHPGEILALNHGGMSFHGGVIGALIAAIPAARLAKIPYLRLTDMGFYAATPGLFFGRCANFINGELWGAPTDLPWGVVFGGQAGTVARHPSQLYEALLEGVVIFIVLFIMFRKLRIQPSGVYTGVFLTLYSVFRILIEFVREPDVQIGYLFGGWLTLGMVLSVPLFICGLLLIVVPRLRQRRA